MPFLIQFVLSGQIQYMQSMHFYQKRRIVFLQSREIVDNFVLAIKRNLYLLRVHFALRNVLKILCEASYKRKLNKGMLFREISDVCQTFDNYQAIPMKQRYKVQQQLICLTLKLHCKNRSKHNGFYCMFHRIYCQVFNIFCSSVVQTDSFDTHLVTVIQ